VNVGQQVGGSIGASLLNTVAISATTTYLSTHRVGPAVAAHATLHGYTVAFWWLAAIFALGGLVCALLLAGRKLGAAAERGVSHRPTAPTARRAPNSRVRSGRTLGRRCWKGGGLGRRPPTSTRR
jgi:hypothetical protein